MSPRADLGRPADALVRAGVVKERGRLPVGAVLPACYWVAQVPRLFDAEWAGGLRGGAAGGDLVRPETGAWLEVPDHLPKDWEEGVAARPVTRLWEPLRAAARWPKRGATGRQKPAFSQVRGPYSACWALVPQAYWRRMAGSLIAGSSGWRPRVPACDSSTSASRARGATGAGLGVTRREPPVPSRPPVRMASPFSESIWAVRRIVSTRRYT